MTDSGKTKAQLRAELADLRARIAALEAEGGEPGADPEGQKAREALRLVVEGTTSAVGEDFLRALVRRLAIALRVRYAFVSEQDASRPTWVRLLAFWEGGGFGKPFAYDVTGTPCEHVMAKTLAWFPSKVQERFPQDAWLGENGIESYLAIPLFDSTNKPAGHLGVMHDQPLAPEPAAESILRVFAARAGAEVERLRADEALRRGRDELEKRVAERTAELLRANAQLRTLASEVSLAEERERRQLALELHDGLTQNLSLAQMKLAALRKADARGAGAAALREIDHLLEESGQQARSLTFELSPPILYDLGFAAAVQWLAQRMQERNGLEITVDPGPPLEPLRVEARVLLFRTVRELLINVVKHAGARRATVSIRSSNGVFQVVVEDDGCGFDAARYACDSHRPGFGLVSIRERLSYLGSEMEIDSQCGRGTRVRIAVPLRQVVEEGT